MSHQDEILTAFNMSEEDLDLNRMGLLSATQMEYLKSFEFRKVFGDLILSHIEIILLISGLVFFVFATLDILIYQIPIFCCGGIVIALLASFWRKMPFTEENERAYVLRVWDGQRQVPNFQINYVEAYTKPKEAVWALQPGRYYRLYYVELNLPLIRDRVVVLGAEDLEPNRI
jgi:hypothetical protein